MRAELGLGAGTHLAIRLMMLKLSGPPEEVCGRFGRMEAAGFEGCAASTLRTVMLAFFAASKPFFCAPLPFLRLPLRGELPFCVGRGLAMLVARRLGAFFRGTKLVVAFLCRVLQGSGRLSPTRSWGKVLVGSESRFLLFVVAFRVEEAKSRNSFFERG
jgi:hypothetical protein